MNYGPARPFAGARRFGRLLLCLALLMGLLAPAVSAAAPERADPVRHGDNCSAVIYNNTNGLPTSEANAIAQTAEGFLWIGSYSGLIRYDGNTFERMDSTTGVTSVVSLFVDRQNRLWIGTNDSGLAMLERGKFRLWKEDGLDGAKVSGIVEDEDGTIFLGTASGVTTIGPDMIARPVEDPRLQGVYVDKIRLGSDGRIYCISNQDDLFVLRGTEVIEYRRHEDSPIQGITSILPDPDAPGKMYLGTENSEIYYGDPNGAPEEMLVTDISPLFSVSYMQKLGDQVWICTRNGLGVVDADGFHCLNTLPLNNSINYMMADYEGNLWFSSSRQGVMKLASNQFSDVFARYGLEPRVVNSTCVFDGRLFIATDTGLLVLEENGPVESLPLTGAKTASGKVLEARDLLKMLEGQRIRSILRDSRGNLWLSTWRSHGLLRYDGKKLLAFTEADGLLSNHVRAVCEAPDGRILVACTGGVCVIKGDRVEKSYGKENGLTNPESLTVAAAANGDIVLGSDGGGIFVINDEGTRCIGTKEGLGSGIVMRIRRDVKRDIFWIVTGNSIAYMTPDYRVTTIQKFPYSNNFDLYENSKGDMWILSSNGIYVTSTEELLANGEIRPVHYGMANGLPCITTSNSYSELTPEGDLYIAGTSGVARVNIETPMEDISDLKQAVPYIDADGELLFPDETGAYRLPSSVRKLTVYAFVYNYSLTDPKISYRLEGFDLDYVTVSRSELGPVTYTNLPGGSYRFVMELKDAMGHGSKTAVIPITKEKALYEQPWFYVVLGLAAALALGLVIQAYVRRKMRLLEEKHREAEAKQRISSELEMAMRIQRSMLPQEFPPFPDRHEFDLYASMDPAREVGGDFYDFYLLDDDHLGLVMADVSGKGIPGALVMMISKVIIHSFAMMSGSAAEILTKTNERLTARNQLEMFVTVWMGILEISTGRIVAANAGHEYPAIKRADGRFELFKDKHGLVIGGMEGVEYREYDMQLSPGDKLFLYTDGVPEATAAGDRMFGTDRMLDALNTDPEAGPEQLLKNVRRAVDEFVRDAEQFDDLTMMCIRYNGPDGRK